MKYLLLGFMFFAISSVKADSKNVMVSFSVLQNLVREIAPAQIEVVALVPEGHDAHHFDLTSKDLIRLKKASLVISIGSGFDNWVQKAVTASQSKAAHVVLTQDLTDPHLWLDVEKTIDLVEKMARALISAWPQDKMEIDRKKNIYLKKLKDLHQEIKNELGGIPTASRSVVVPHMSFGHFERAYGIHFISPRGLTTDEEPTAKNVARIIRSLKSKKAKAIFQEFSEDHNILRQISQESGIPIGGVLYSESLSKKVPDYISMMRANKEALLESLKGAQ